MKKYFYLLVLAILAIPQLQAENYEINHENKLPSRVEKKAFKGVQQIRIEHAYGNITIKESKSSEVQLEIHYFDNKNRKMNTDISHRKNALSIKTSDSKKNYSRGAKVDYILSVPRKNSLEVDLSYGNLKIDNLTGSGNIKLEYGNLNANMMGDVTVRGKYNEITFNHMKDCVVSCDYSKIKINKVNNLELRSKYTDYNISLAESVTKGSYSEHGDVKLNLVKSVDISLKYSDISINKLDEKLRADCDYSDVNVDLADKTLKSIDIKSAFSDINIGLNNSLAAEIDLKTSMGEIDIAKKFDQNYTYIKKDSGKETRKGSLGRGKSTASINVTTTFADIVIK